MATGVRLYVGSHEGLFVWRSRNGDWEAFIAPGPRGVIEALDGCKTHPERVYAGVAHDGLYRSEDAGKTWKKLFVGDVRAVDMDPAADDVVYLGTQPVHLYRSEDRGESWEEITAIQELPYAIRERWGFPGRQRTLGT